MLRNKEESLSWVLGEEIPHRSDRRFGLSLLSLCFLRGEAGPSDLRGLTAEEALPLYEDVWNELGCEELEAGVDFFLFDTAIFFDPPVAKHWLRLLPEQRELGVDATIGSLEFFRRRRLKLDPQWAAHGPEWTNRCNRAKRKALQLAQVGPGYDEATEKVRHAHA